MNKKILSLGVIGVFAIALSLGALIPYFGQIVKSVNVEQGMFLDGNDWNESVFIESDLTSLGGLITSSHILQNSANVDAKVNLSTYCNSDVSPDSCDDIETKYYISTDYSEEFLASDTHFNNTNVIVEDLGDSVLWTLKVPMNATYGTGRGSGGQVALSVSIGVGNEILYQVHSNDGTDSNYSDGEWLYSEYDNGWQTGDSNTPVENIEGINASGERFGEEEYTIEIDKSLLDLEEFKWVVYSNYETDSLPDNFSWSDTNTNNFQKATVANELIGDLTIPAGTNMDFVVSSNFPAGTYPGEYILTTNVEMA